MDRRMEEWSISDSGDTSGVNVEWESSILPP